MFEIEVKDFSERSYPRHLIVKAGRIGALRLVNISEAKEGGFDFIVEVDDWAVLNALNCIDSKEEDDQWINIKMKNAKGELIEMKMPEWAIASIVIAVLSTCQLSKMFER